MTGSRPQWYNGIVLLSSFFCCRLLWGTYQSIHVYQDVWTAIYQGPFTRTNSIFEPSADSDEVMRFAGESVVPVWLAGVYMGSNIVLNTLNFYWFGKMIETIKKRFTEVKGKKKDGQVKEKDEGVMVEGLIDSSTLITEIVDEDGGLADGMPGDKGSMKKGMANGRSTIEVENTQVRRRN